MGDDFQNTCDGINSFDIPSEMLDEIQKNIEEIIANFPVPEDNKLDVIKKINFMYSHTKYMSLTDPLTGLYNRRHFDNCLEREFLRSKRYGGTFSVAIIDIDFFKKVNDTYGHLCGDFVLREVAYLLIENFRKTDMVFRYGGEEFVVILTETDLAGAEISMERLRKRIEDNDFMFNSQLLKLTVSCGISINGNLEFASDVIDNADKALYRAKQNGRNRIEVF